MRFICDDPMQTVNRVIDIARRLGLDLEALGLQRLNDTQSLIVVQLTDPGSHAASVFVARVRQLADLKMETLDA